MESSSQHCICIFSLETYDFMNSMIKTQTAEYGTFRRDLGCGKPGQLISGAQNHFQVRKNICRQGSGALWVRPLRCGRPGGR